MDKEDQQGGLYLSEEFHEVCHCVDDYERRYREGNRFPNIEECLATVSPDHRRVALLEIAQVDMEQRWKEHEKSKSGKTTREYLKEFPELSGDSQSVATLVRYEHQLRCRYDSNFSPDLHKMEFPAVDFCLVTNGDDPELAKTSLLDHKMPASTSAEDDLPDHAELETVESSQSKPVTKTPQCIDKYQVVAKLGEGAFGTVYKAYHPDLQKHVAIKIAKAQVDRDMQKAFLHEARCAAALPAHENLVTVHDFGVWEDSRPYIVYDMIDGESLADRLSRGYQLDEAIEWIAQVGHALQVAHGHDVVHRDVKPSNILIDRKGHAVLIDFGLATKGDAFFQKQRGPIGTCYYMSPEQTTWRSDWAQPASDIYSLGTVLYELLTAQRPFDSTDRAELIEQIRNRIPASPRSINPDIPKQIELVCLKALSKNPLERHQTAGDMTSELRYVPPRRKWIPWLGPLVVAVALLVALFWPSTRAELRYIDLEQNGKVVTNGYIGDSIPLDFYAATKDNRSGYFSVFVYRSNQPEPALFFEKGSAKTYEHKIPLALDKSPAVATSVGDGQPYDMMTIVVGVTDHRLSKNQIEKLRNYPLSQIMPAPESFNERFTADTNVDAIRDNDHNWRWCGDKKDNPDSRRFDQDFRDLLEETFPAARSSYFAVMFAVARGPTPTENITFE